MNIQLNKCLHEVMERAHKEARQTENYLMTGSHVLVAILLTGCSVAADLLFEAGLDVDKVRGHLREKLKIPSLVVPGEIRQSAALQDGFDVARYYVLRNEDKELCPTYLLLALIQTDDNMRQALEHFKFRPAELSAKLSFARKKERNAARAKMVMEAFAKEVKVIGGSHPGSFNLHMDSLSAEMREIVCAWLGIPPEKTLASLSFTEGPKD